MRPHAFWCARSAFEYADDGLEILADERARQIAMRFFARGNDRRRRLESRDIEDRTVRIAQARGQRHAEPGRLSRHTDRQGGRWQSQP